MFIISGAFCFLRLTGGSGDDIIKGGSAMKDLGTRTLETPRLLLRPFAAGDAHAMFTNWASDPEVTRFLVWPPHGDESVSLAYCRELEAGYGDPTRYDWAIVLRELGEPIGSMGVVQRGEAAESVHIGYCIGRSWWHRGFTSEALKRVIQYLFEEVGVNRIDSRHDPRNPHSGQVMAKCGMVYEGTHRQSDRNNQGICDAAWYAILKEDYEKGRECP